MAAKAEIQYVSQFYVYGSEAKKLEPKRQEHRRKAVVSQTQTEQEKVISIDLVALIGLMVAVAMLVCLVVCTLQISDVWQEYDAVSQYMSVLAQKNAELKHTYVNGYDLAEVEATALALGMIPATEANTRVISVSIPEPEAEPGLVEEVIWFLEGLFA